MSTHCEVIMPYIIYDIYIYTWLYIRIHTHNSIVWYLCHPFISLPILQHRDQSQRCDLVLKANRVLKMTFLLDEWDAPTKKPMVHTLHPFFGLRRPLRVSPSHLLPIGRWRTWWCLAVGWLLVGIFLGIPKKLCVFWSQKNHRPRYIIII